MGVDDFSPDRQKIQDISVSANPEDDVMKEVEGREYISLDEFYRLLDRAGVDRSKVRRGTYPPGKDGQVYVYAKLHFISSTLERAKEKLQYCQEITRLGALFPGTKWGIFQRASGQFQIFAVTRRLELAPPSGDPLRNSNILHERLGATYRAALDEGEANRNPMGRLPGFSELYPVDIEVIGLVFDEAEAVQAELKHQAGSKTDTILKL